MSSTASPTRPHAGKMELVYGKVVVHAPPSGKDGERAGNIDEALRVWARTSGLAKVTVETGYLLKNGPDLVRGPDVSVLLRTKLTGGDLPEEGYVPVPPDLAAEVVSPGDSQRDVLEKVEEYLDAGAGRVWLVQANPQRVVVYGPAMAMRIAELGDVLGPADLGIEGADFALPVRDIFR